MPNRILNEDLQMHRNKHTNEKLEHIEKILSTLLALVGTIATIISPLSSCTHDKFTIETCSRSIVTRIDDKYIKYDITTTPPLSMAKLCVQPYIEVVYNQNHYLILLNGIFTQKAYVSENEHFSLLKEETSETIVKKIKDIIFDTILSNNLDVTKLIINEDVILCFAYSESEHPGTYYFFNQALPKKTTRFKALRLLNPTGQRFEIDIQTLTIDDLSLKIQDIVTEIANEEKR